MKKLRDFLRPTFHYWMETEVHVYCFSIAANVLLSFFPFLLVMMSICKYVLHWDAAINALFFALNDYFPGDMANFIQRNLFPKRLEWLSLLLLLFTANGVFEPLEVALNRAWGIPTNRSFLKNQLISYALIFACGSMALLSTTLTAMNETVIRSMGISNEALAAFVAAAFFKMAAIPLVIAALVLMYWALPNGKVALDRIIVAGIFVGLLLEVLKYLQLLVWPWLFGKLQREYGPFRISVAMILFSFCASMLVLAGAEWASRPARNKPADVPEPAPEQTSSAAI